MLIVIKKYVALIRVNDLDIAAEAAGAFIKTVAADDTKCLMVMKTQQSTRQGALSNFAWLARNVK